MDMDKMDKDVRARFLMNLYSMEIGDILPVPSPLGELDLNGNGYVEPACYHRVPGGWCFETMDGTGMIYVPMDSTDKPRD